MPSLKTLFIPTYSESSGVRTTYDQLTAQHIVHGDPELHNFIWTGQEIVALDFEFAELLRPDSVITNEHELNTVIDEISAVILMANPEWALL